MKYFKTKKAALKFYRIVRYKSCLVGFLQLENCPLGFFVSCDGMVLSKKDFLKYY